MLTFILPETLKEINRQIYVLELVIPKDNNKDKAIHKNALTQLNLRRKELMKDEPKDMPKLQV